MCTKIGVVLRVRWLYAICPSVLKFLPLTYRRLMAKILTIIQVNLVPNPSELGEGNTNSTMAFLWAHIFLQLCCFGIDYTGFMESV